MRELIDLRLAVKNLTVLAGDGLVTLADLLAMFGYPGPQAHDHFTQRLGVQICQGFKGDNHARKCARDKAWPLWADVPIDTPAIGPPPSHQRDNAALANALPRQSEHQGIELRVA